MSSSLTPGVKFAISYQVNFNRKLSLNIGGEATLAERNFIIDFNKSDFLPPLTEDYHFTGKQTRAGDLFLNVPITFEKRIWYKNKQFLFLETGLNFNVSTGADADISDALVKHTDGSFSQPVEIYVYSNNDAKPWLSYLFGLGTSWRLRNNNLIQLGIIANLSFTKYVNGTYAITVPNQPATTGEYSSTGTYYGVYVCYSLTNANYRLRKLHEKNDAVIL